MSNIPPVATQNASNSQVHAKTKSVVEEAGDGEVNRDGGWWVEGRITAAKGGRRDGLRNPYSRLHSFTCVSPRGFPMTTKRDR